MTELVKREPKLNPRETIVMDPDDLKELDELSLTRILRDVSEYAEQLHGSDGAQSRQPEDSESDVDKPTLYRPDPDET